VPLSYQLELELWIEEKVMIDDAISMVNVLLFLVSVINVWQ